MRDDAKQGHLVAILCPRRTTVCFLVGQQVTRGHFPVLPRGYHSTHTLSEDCLPVTQDKQQVQKWEELGGFVKLKRFNPSQLTPGSTPLNQKLPRGLPVGYSAGQGLTQAVLTSGQPDTNSPHLKVCFQMSSYVRTHYQMGYPDSKK